MEEGRLARLFDDYAAYHRHPINKLMHYIGVPLIILTVVGLLTRVELGPVNLGVLVAMGAVAYNLRLSVKLTLPFVAFVGLCFLVAPLFPVAALWVGFLGGWALQFVGHFAYEKKSPAFFANLRQLLVGPLWLVQEAIGQRKHEGPAES